MIRMADPWALALLPLLLAAAIWLWRRRQPGLRPRMRYSSVDLIGSARRTARSRLLALPLGLMLMSALLLILALARPQSAWSEHHRFAEGIDIMLVIDVSDSMLAQDFQPNRLEKSKAVVKEFIDGRREDQIGLVIFARESFTLCPLTHDYQALNQFVDYIDFNILNGDATAIGMGLATATDRLRKSDARSKVVILLTDGENNAGRIDPLTAGRVAQALGVRVYTIGVGSPGKMVPVPVRNIFGQIQMQMIPSRIDLEELTEIAEMTGGQFFLATDGKSLEEIYRQIDRMERRSIEISDTQYFDDLAHWLIWPALGLLLLAFLLEHTWLRTFP